MPINTAPYQIACRKRPYSCKMHEHCCCKRTFRTQASLIADDAKVFFARSNKLNRGPSSSDHYRDSSSVNQKNNSPAKICGRCGAKGHKSSDCKCSKNIICYKCNKLGHFSSMCKSQQKKHRPQNRRHNSVRFLSNQNNEPDRIDSGPGLYMTPGC